MRVFAVFWALAASVSAAACGESRPSEGRAVDDAVVAPAPERAASEATNSADPAPPATGKTIPAALLGTYDASLEACGRASDARLTVTASELRFHESIGTVRKVTPVGGEAVSVEADYQGEGERWRSVRELRPGAGTLTVSGDGTSLVRVRCPAEPR